MGDDLGAVLSSFSLTTGEKEKRPPSGEEHPCTWRWQRFAHANRMVLR